MNSSFCLGQLEGFQKQLVNLYSQKNKDINEINRVIRDLKYAIEEFYEKINYEYPKEIIGSYKVVNFNKENKTITFNIESKNPLEIQCVKTYELSPNVIDDPKIGYSYMFEIQDNLVYKIITATVDCIIYTQSDILLIKRKHNPYKDYLALPGGVFDAGESAIDTARREVFEEVGLKDLEMIFENSYTKPNRDPRMTHTWCYAFSCKVDQVNPTAGDDAAEVVWIPIKEIQNHKLAFDHNEIIKDFIIRNNL